mgnify:CR=1 FL=1
MHRSVDPKMESIEMDIKPIHKASCHCGSVELEVSLPNGLVDPHRCDCSDVQKKRRNCFPCIVRRYKNCKR